MMTDNQCLGITLMQMFNQFSQSYLLCFRPGILRSLSVGIQTTYIAYTDTVTVVAFAMCADHFRWASGFYSSVCRNHIVVTTALPAQ